MVLPFPTETVRAFRAGTPEEAAAAADAVLQTDPFAAEAHLVKALLALRANDMPAVIEHFRKAMTLRPADWVIEKIRQNFQAKGRPPLTREAAFRLGALFRSHLSALGPALEPSLRRANGEYMNVVGSSYVRSFGGDPAFFPLFIGMGPTMMLLTEEQAAVTRRKTRENLKRVDLTRNTMLILGADPYYYGIELGNRNEQRQGWIPTKEDTAVMAAAAERHRPILKDAKAMVTGRLMLLAVTPTHHPLVNAFCRIINEHLAQVCAEEDILFLDWWNELADPQTGFLRDEYSANAYPGDIHFTLSCTERFMTILRDMGLFSDAITPSTGFEWTHVFEASIDASEKTRIWCEPSVTPRNAFQSNKIAASHLSSQVADLLTTLSIRSPDQTFLMVNVRDAFLPVVLPRQVHMGCVAFTDGVQNLMVGQQVLDFYGRLDVELKPATELASLAGQVFSHVVLLIHPDSMEADEQRARDAVGRLAAAPAIIVATPRPERIDVLGLSDRPKNIIPISNRHIPEIWRDYSIVMVN